METKETKPVVLQTMSSTSSIRAQLESRFETYQLWEQRNPEAFLAQRGPFIRAIVATGGGTFPITEATVSRLPNLELVACYSVGTDYVDIPYLKSRGIALTNTPDVLNDAVAESAILLLLATMRKLVVADRFVRSGLWSTKPNLSIGLTSQLSKKRVGIVGLGRIGTAIAVRLEAFGCSIGYWSRSAKPQFPAYEFFGDLVELASESDVLIAACALTDETVHIINREVFDALGPSGFIVNIARGKVVHEAELVLALLEGRIAGAGLDVFANEPHVPKELFHLENVVLQPHLAPGTVETIDAMTELVVGNVEAHFAGRPLLTPVL